MEHPVLIYRRRDVGIAEQDIHQTRNLRGNGLGIGGIDEDIAFRKGISNVLAKVIADFFFVFYDSARVANFSLLYSLRDRAIRSQSACFRMFLGE